MKRLRELRSDGKCPAKASRGLATSAQPSCSPEPTLWSRCPWGETTCRERPGRQPACTCRQMGPPWAVQPALPDCTPSVTWARLTERPAEPGPKAADPQNCERVKFYFEQLSLCGLEVATDDRCSINLLILMNTHYVCIVVHVSLIKI